MEKVFDKNGKTIKIGDNVIWYDPQEETRDLKRIYNVYDIKGDIVCVSDEYSEAEVLPNELIVISKLDTQEKRAKGIEIVKDKMFNLLIDYMDYCFDDHPSRDSIRKEKIDELWVNLCLRKQDYEAFMWDYEKDWDLNYDDYGLETRFD